MPEINIAVILIFCIALIPILCFYIVIRNIIILIYTIKYRNISQEDKISEIYELVAGFGVCFLWGGVFVALFTLDASSKLAFPLSLLLFIFVCIISLLPYVFRIQICFFLVRKFIDNINPLTIDDIKKPIIYDIKTSPNTPLWTWIPNTQLNDLYFGKPYTEFDAFITEKYDVLYSRDVGERENEVLYRSKIRDSSLKFTEKTHKFISARIWSNLYYQNHNLIGLTLEELEEILNVDDLQVTRDGRYYETRKLNAQFRIEKKVKNVYIFLSKN